jgi:tetratricopeptide (TPR) repeat protein
MRQVLGFLASLAAAGGAAHADQTDSRLDLLFEELRTGEAIRAEENVARIIELWSDAQSDTVDLLFARAEESMQNGNDELALALLDHVVGLAPNFAQGYALRGVVRSRLQDNVGAIEDFSKVLELEPRHFDIRVNLAQRLQASGAKREAYEMYQKALEWNPHDEYARREARALRRALEGQDI